MKPHLLSVLVMTVLVQFSLNVIPGSPFGSKATICPSSAGGDYDVGGFPGTPFFPKVFTATYESPKEAVPKEKKCRSDGHCMFSFQVDIFQTQKFLYNTTFPSCKSRPTWFLSYDGQIPGKTFVIPTGHQSMIRYNNKITNKFFKPLDSCLDQGKKGRPTSVHNHGHPSLAPFDGWADDITCQGQSKDYILPNTNSRLAWYHDHAADHTAANAYFGLVGVYIVSDKKKHGGCGEAYNLQNVEQRIMIIKDYLLDRNCQLRLDQEDSGIHGQFGFYGDINAVNGIPFPKMPMQPKWYRFRFLGGSVTRPWLVQIRTQKRQIISDKICKVIGGDGGLRAKPSVFPTAGLLIGVAERYDVVCDLSGFAGKLLYWWNDKDVDRQLNVPYFCFSHLIARMIVSSTVSANNILEDKQKFFVDEEVQDLNPRLLQSSTSFFDENALPKAQNLVIRQALLKSDLDAAKAMVAANKFHRLMDFQRVNGHWMINNENWHTFKIAADNVGQNTWEIWKLRTGGGWFHPVHVHLVDFFILKRVGPGSLQPYEDQTPKDVAFLTANSDLYVLARFGAHQGDYMFHCHNMIHEDDTMLRAFRVGASQKGPNGPTNTRFIINGFTKMLYDNFAFKDPMLGQTGAILTSKVVALSTKLSNNLQANIYRIFYPTTQDLNLPILKGAINPWKTPFCPIN